MHRTQTKSGLLLIAAAMTFGLSSCNKSNLTDNTEVLAAQNFSAADVEDDNVQIMADQAQSGGDISVLRTGQPANNTAVDLITGCAVVSRDTISSPRTITIDFGSGCTNANGVIRKGKIIVTYSGRYREAGTVVHIVSENYYVNANKVDIDRSVTNLGTNDAGNLIFGIHATRTLTFPDGSTSTSISDRIREWTAGDDTPGDITDDVFSVTGSGTHTSRRGMPYAVSTVTPLIRKVACHEFVSGVVKITRTDNRNRSGSINFGSGECDNEASVTLDNGRTFSIDLRH